MRLGAFEGPSGQYGIPVNVVHPSDNDITPTTAQAEADRAKAAADDLYADIQNAIRRDPNAHKAVQTP